MLSTTWISADFRVSIHNGRLQNRFKDPTMTPIFQVYHTEQKGLLKCVTRLNLWITFRNVDFRHCFPKGSFWFSKKDNAKFLRKFLFQPKPLLFPFISLSFLRDTLKMKRTLKLTRGNFIPFRSVFYLEEGQISYIPVDLQIRSLNIQNALFPIDI